MKRVVEALLMASPRPLQFNELARLLTHDGRAPDRALLGETIAVLEAECAERALELTQVASGYRYQTREEYAPWLARLWEEKPPRYSKALLETLALIAYRQPITRAAIEDVRGVSVSSGTLRILEERGWIEIAGHKETPGRPALYATTRAFLDDLNLRSLDELPALAAPTPLADADADTEAAHETQEVAAKPEASAPVADADTAPGHETQDVSARPEVPAPVADAAHSVQDPGQDTEAAG